jgi:hypothetical protein
MHNIKYLVKNHDLYLIQCSKCDDMYQKPV